MFERRYQKLGLVLGALAGLIVFGLASVGLAALGGAVGVPAFLILAVLGYAVGKVRGLRRDRDAIAAELAKVRDELKNLSN